MSLLGTPFFLKLNEPCMDGRAVKLKALQRLVPDHRKDEACKEREQRSHHGKGADNQRRELPDEPGVQVANKHRDKEADGNQREDSGKDAEELQRTVMEEHPADGEQDLYSVRYSIEL